MKRIFAFVIGLAILLCSATGAASAAKNTEDVVILYENDVHCEVAGYSKLSALKQELSETYAHVGVVSSGDYLQGSTYGVVSRGEYIVNLMNLVGYDALALGNHEFDYLLPRLEELVGKMKTKPVCCNFSRIGALESYFEPYQIVSYGEVDVAFVGILTPATITGTSPAQFEDEEGNFVFTFHPDDLYEVVQQSIDDAKKEGADYVIALSHVGDRELLYDVEEVIANTTGFDAVLDAHSHSVIEGYTVRDRAGEDVLLTSTGAKFEYVGKLTLSDGEVSAELLPLSDYEKTDPAVDAYLLQIEEEYSALGDAVVGVSEVSLITHDGEGNRLVRVSETNLGDFCADALRHAVGADIGYINGGGIRAEIGIGEVTYNDLLSVFPFNNTVVLSEIDGKTFRDVLEMALLEWPEECSFPHVSGVTFSVNTELESSVVVDENEAFCGLDGPYRVYDIRVYNPDTDRYEPMELDKTYTIASNNYYLVDHGSGMTMLENTKVIKNDGMLDVEALVQYVREDLGGVIGEEYRETEESITFTEGEIYPEQALNLWWGIALLPFVLALAALVFVLVKKRRGKAA